jgi:hypothetical protein
LVIKYRMKFLNITYINTKLIFYKSKIINRNRIIGNERGTGSYDSSGGLSALPVDPASGGQTQSGFQQKDPDGIHGYFRQVRASRTLAVRVPRRLVWRYPDIRRQEMRQEPEPSGK